MIFTLFCQMNAVKMSEEKIFSFNDLSAFCDESISQIRIWREIFKLQCEEYLKIVSDNENTRKKVVYNFLKTGCVYNRFQLCEIKWKVNVLNWLQEEIQRDLCESESNYIALEKHVGELEAALPTNDVDDPHCEVYTPAVSLDASLNTLQEALEFANTNLVHQEAQANKDPVSLLIHMLHYLCSFSCRARIVLC